jgi:diguanylate cyclase (GGDEF)-like protein
VTSAAAGLAAAREREEDLAPRRLFGGAACAALGTLAAGWVDVRIEQSGVLPPPALAAAAGGAAFVLIRVLGEFLAFPSAVTARRPATGRPMDRVRRMKPNLMAVGLEATGWGVGALLAWTAGSFEQPIVPVVLLFTFALVAGEAGRQAALRRRSETARAALERELLLDPLTGAAAEARLEPALAAGFARSLENAEPFAVALFDIDHLRRRNEALGRASGNEALKALAQTLEAQARPGQSAIRAGGGRLCLLCDATDGAHALRLAEAVRRSVESGAPPAAFTVSAGVAAAPEVFARSGEELLLLAEDALGHAKDLGRNVCLLALGGGRFQDGGGATLDTVEGERVLRSPQIFA